MMPCINSSEKGLKPEKIIIDGILVLDKPAGMTSNRALQKVKRLVNAKKAGHVGTLDPFASGMLPICFGRATKLSEQLLVEPKCYHASLHLGQATTTGDPEGAVCAEKPVPHFNDTDLEAIFKRFIGEIMQVPPMYSALKYQGRPLYEYARRGEVVERKARPASIYQLNLLEYTATEIQFEVICGKGVYIRTLAEAIAQALDTFGHLTALRRVYSSGFTDKDLHSLEEIEAVADKLPLFLALLKR